MVKKLSNAEAKRLILSIQSKTRKLWLSPTQINPLAGVCTTKDMSDIEKVVNRMLKRVR